MHYKTTLSISFSDEELLVILAYLKIPFVMGLNLETINKMSEEQLRIIMAVAERGLIARDLLSRKANHWVLRPEAMTLVGACAIPETTLIVTQERPETIRETFFYHTARKIIVSHTQPVSFIHQFIMLKDLKSVAQSTLTIIKMNSQSVESCHRIRLTVDIIAKTRNIAQTGGVDNARTFLLSHSVPIDTATKFAEALSNPISNTTFVYMKHGSNINMSDGFTVLAGQNETWFMQPLLNKNDEDPPVIVETISQTGLIEKVQKLLL